jgi:hypothetical protein
MSRSHLIVCGFVALAACATESGGTGGNADFKPTGRITIAAGNGAIFNATQVSGPKIHVQQRQDGSWGGTITGSAGTQVPIDCTFQGGQFVGSNLRMTITRADQQTTISGTFNERIVRFEFTPTEIRVRTPSRSENYVKLPAEGEYGGPTTVKLEGEAATFPPTPAFALAALGGFI